VFFFKPRLHNTTCCQTGWLSNRLSNRFDNRLYRVYKHSMTTGLTTGYIVYTAGQNHEGTFFVKDSIISRVLIRLSFSDLGTEWSGKLCTCLTGIKLLKLGTHYPCPRAVFTGRRHGPWTWVSKMTPVFTSRVGHQCIQHGPWTRVSFLTPMFTGRVYGPWTRPVDTGSVYRALVT